MQPCQWLDDYLLHDLDGEQHDSFTAHLADCATCRRAVLDHERLGSLLMEATVRLEPIPPDLVRRVRSRLRVGRRRRSLAIAAALAAVAVTGWLLGRAISDFRGGGQELVEHRPVEGANDPPQSVEVAGIRFPAQSRMLAVSQTIDVENVTFVWVYPGLREPSRAATVEVDSDLSPERSDP